MLAVTVIALAFLGILWREIVFGLGLATVAGTVAAVTLIVVVLGGELFSPAEPTWDYPPAQSVSFDQFARIPSIPPSAQMIR